MKKVLIGLSLLAALGLHADDNIQGSMKNMRDGLLQVQDGFLYNNKDSILKGIDKIKKANSAFHDAKSSASFLPQDKKRFSKVAYINVKNLNFYLDTMKEYVKAGSIVNASDAYSGVVHSCTHCHAITRGW
ncbi:hypothetical protein [Sulfurimonas sp. HSL-1716]|uniref:hypothetical protein n=1 Tax=Hydrocurvibacter sulfurireducens TaxID=3131937 RepID=UPI0031FA31A7